jgi:hypothetical protein
MMKESQQERCTLMSLLQKTTKAEDEQVQESENEDSELDEDSDTETDSNQ